MGMIFVILKGFGLSDNWVKIFGPIIEVLLLLFGLYSLYWYGGHVERVKWQQKIVAYRHDMDVAKAAGNAQLQAMQTNNLRVVADLKQQLDAARAQKARVKTLVKEVTKYVDSKADSRCVVPVGFVRMSNLSLSPEVSGLPAGDERDVGAPSGVALSTVASVTADNYGECVARGEVIKAWQQWYTQTKNLWDTTKANMPVMPEVPK